VGGFALATTPTVAPMPAFGGWPYGGYPFPPYLTGAGSTLQGLASLTAATGQYWNQIGQAQLTREQARQARFDTARKGVEFEMWYETVRPTAPRMLKAQQASELDWARNFAQNTQIWSGRPLNVLLRSILRSPQPTSGPNIPLDEQALRGINLTDGTTRANLSMTRDEGRIDWPEALQAESYDEVRDRFSKTFEAASRQVHSTGPPSRAMITSLRTDWKTLSDKLDDQVADLAPSRYIESRRLLNQLRETVNGLADPRLCKACHGDWRKNVRNVAELVAHCMKNGLEFGPAVSGGETSYTITFHALRNYERALVQYGQ
jgi:hypothetical protein